MGALTVTHEFDCVIADDPAAAGFSVVEPASLTAKGQFIIRPIVRSSGVVALQSHVSSEASVRVVNVLNELRDLEDMIDLYELLIAA